jgi:hypothetical protein
MSNAEATAPVQQRVIGRPFKPGQSGNPAGRAVGSRNRLADSFLLDLKDAWQRHGVDALDRVARDQPEVLVKVIASLLPKDVSIDVNVMHDVGNVVEAYRQMATMLGVDPASGLRRLKAAPMLEHADAD